MSREPAVAAPLATPLDGGGRNGWGPALRGAVRLAVLALSSLLFVSGLRAETLYVETLEVNERASARQCAEAAQQKGLQTRVIRRFQRGEGWLFRVRVGPLSDRETAQDRALALARSTGLSTTIYLVAGRDLLPVGEVPGDSGIEGTENPGGGAAGGPTEVSGDGTGGEELLAAVRRAHGRGGDLASHLAEAGTLHFRFERRLRLAEADLRIWHDYWRSGGSYRLEVRVLEGEGKDSVAVVGGEDGAAYLRVDGSTREVDPGAVRGALEAFRPERVMAQVLEILDLPGTGGVSAREEPAGDGSGIGLVLEGPGLTFPLALRVDEADHRIRWARISRGFRWDFADYHEMDGGWVVPFRVEVWRDEERRERVDILELEVDPAVPAGLFAAP